MARRILRNVQWDWIKDLLPGKASNAGGTAADNRQFLEAVLWILRQVGIRAAIGVKRGASGRAMTR